MMAMDQVILWLREQQSAPGHRRHKIIKRAGFAPWPRALDNLRSSCEIDLIAVHPAHVASEWVGHDIEIAQKHYLKAIDRNSQPL